MKKWRFVGCLVVLSACAAVAAPQARAQSPIVPWNFCVCCYFKFMDAGTYAYFYAHDCVNDRWIGYCGPSTTPITQGACDTPCPSDCVSSPFPSSPSSAVERQEAPSLAAGPLVYLGKGFGIHDTARRAGLEEPRNPLQALRLETDPDSPYEANLLDDCWAKVQLPGGGHLPVKLALVAVRSKLKPRVQEIEGVLAPTKVLGLGWEVKRLPLNVDDGQVVKVKSSQVVPVGPSGAKTRTLWISLPAGDFQVLTNTENDVP